MFAESICWLVHSLRVDTSDYPQPPLIANRRLSSTSSNTRSLRPSPEESKPRTVYMQQYLHSGCSYRTEALLQFPVQRGFLVVGPYLKSSLFCFQVLALKQHCIQSNSLHYLHPIFFLSRSWGRTLKLLRNSGWSLGQNVNDHLFFSSRKCLIYRFHYVPRLELIIDFDV